MSPSLTAIVPTFNEESNIVDCLATLSLADEILVVDSFSTDRTVERAQEFGRVRVLTHAYEGNGPQCNWAMDQVLSEWVLIVDADERVPPELAREIRTAVEAGAPQRRLYRLRRTNYFLGRPIHGAGWGRDRLVRLLARGAARYPERKVHADIDAPSSTPTLRTPLIHHSSRSLEQTLEKADRYARLGAQDLFDAGRHSGALAIALRPLWRFFRSYILEAGFRDGVHGLILCGVQAYGTFLKWTRLWALERRA